MNSFEAEKTQEEITALRAALQSSACTRAISSLMVDIPDSEEVTCIKSALELNKKMDDDLSSLLVNMAELLSECQEKIQNVRSKLSNNPSGSVKVSTCSYFHCGRPYFKDKARYACPRNPDTLQIAQAKYADYGNLIYQNLWTAVNKKSLEGAILRQAQKKRQQSYMQDLRCIDRTLSKMEVTPESLELVESIEKERIQCTSKLKSVKDLSLADLVLPLKDNEDFDWEGISQSSAINHTAIECKAMWRTFLHPCLNKKAWKSGEAQLLKRLVRRHRRSNWEAIARRLSTGRSAYQCFVYNEVHLSKSSTYGLPWTEEEEEFLDHVVDFCRVGDAISWAKVAFHFENRTKEQIYSHWRMGKGFRLGRFSAEEDHVLLAGVRDYGRHFKSLSSLIPGRTSVQLRERYLRLLSLRNPRNFWSLADDLLLLELASQAKVGTKLADYKHLEKHFKGKCPYKIKKRYMFLNRWLSQNPGQHLSSMKRTVSKNNDLNPKIDLAAAVKKLQHSWKSGAITMKPQSKDHLHRKAQQQSAHNMALIDNDFVDYFKADLVPTRVDFSSIRQDLPELKAILNLLGANLNKDLMTSLDFKCADDRVKSLAEKLFDETAIILPPVKTTALKTYSRKKPPTQNINPDSSTSSQLNQPCVNNMSYTFPASFGTLYAMNVLLCENTLNVNLSLRKPQLHKLQSRFEKLFMWPTIISNIPPNPVLVHQCKLETSGESVDDENDLPQETDPSPADGNDVGRDNGSEEINNTQEVVCQANVEEERAVKRNLRGNNKLVDYSETNKRKHINTQNITERKTDRGVTTDEGVTKVTPVKNCEGKEKKQNKRMKILE